LVPPGENVSLIGNSRLRKPVSLVNDGTNLDWQ
jgi:hypothetical protein